MPIAGAVLFADTYCEVRRQADSQCHAPRAARATSKPLKELRAATFSARAETVETKPIFRDAFKRTRCLIPVCGYYPFIAINMRRESIDHVDPRTVAVWSLIGRNLFLITNARVSMLYLQKSKLYGFAGCLCRRNTIQLKPHRLQIVTCGVGRDAQDGGDFVG
jgi:hypothetical protein